MAKEQKTLYLIEASDGTAVAKYTYGGALNYASELRAKGLRYRVSEIPYSKSRVLEEYWPKGD